MDDCQRMAAVFIRHHCDTRQAGQLYAAWRDGPPATRKRILDQPELFFKAQRPVEPKTASAPAATPAAELLRDLDMVVSIVNRASRRLAGSAGEMERQQLEDAPRQIDRPQ